MKISKSIAVLFISFILNQGFAQTSKEIVSYFKDSVNKEVQAGRFRFVDVKGHTGSHLYSGQSLDDYLENGYAGLEIRYGWQTKGVRDWEKAYAYPAFGLGWYSGYVGDPSIFGNPNAMYGFMSFPLSKHKKFTFNIEPALGLTYNLIPYDPNNKGAVVNDAIGSKVCVYFNFNIGGNIQLNREIDFIYGLDLTHFSNGRMFTPNYGLNMLGINVGTRYHFNRDQKKVDPSYNPSTVLAARPTYGEYHAPRKLKSHAIQLYQAFGSVQNDRDAGTDTRYNTASTVLEYQHKFDEMHAFMGGVDLFYDASLGDPIAHPSHNQYPTLWLPGIHAGYGFNWWRLAINMQLGTYLNTAGRTLKGNYFMRPNLKYDINKTFYAQLGLKTLDGGASDWVEWGVGVRLFQQNYIKK